MVDDSNLLKSIADDWADVVPVIDFQSVSVVRNRRVILDEIDLLIEEGDTVGLFGPNGGGKSTLLRVILGLEKVQGGVVEVFKKRPGRFLKKRPLVGYVPQYRIPNPVFKTTVYEMILSGAYGVSRWWLPVKSAYKEHARFLMGVLGIEHLQRESITRLSPGQLQRVYLARAMVMRPRILLLDEPFADMDYRGRNNFHRLLNDFKEQYGLVLVITSQDGLAIKPICERIICLNNSILWECSSNEIRQDDWLEPYQEFSPAPKEDLTPPVKDDELPPVQRGNTPQSHVVDL